MYPVIRHQGVGKNINVVIEQDSTEVDTKSPAQAKKRVQMSDNATPGGLPGQCAQNCFGFVPGIGLDPYQAQKRSPSSVHALSGNSSRAFGYRAAFRK